MIGATPFEAINGHKPDVSQLRVFGSKSLSKIPIDKRKTLQAQSSECILLGYANDAKAYKLIDIATKKFFIKWSVQFEEDWVHGPQLVEEVIFTPSNPFVDNDVFTNISNLESEE